MELLRVLPAVLFSTFLFAGSPVLAAGEVAFQVNQSGLTYSKSTSKQKPQGGTETEETLTEVDTMPADLELVASFRKIYVRIFPLASLGSTDGTDYGGILQAGYEVIPSLEVGALVGVNSTKADEGNTESSTNDVGIYAIYGIKLGGMNLEIGAKATSTSVESEKQNTATPPALEETEMSLTGFGLGAEMIIPLAGNFSYVVGLSYGSLSGDTKTTVAATTVKGDVSVSGFSVTPVKFRADF